MKKPPLFIIIGIVIGLIFGTINHKLNKNPKYQKIPAQSKEEFTLDEGLQDVDEYEAPEENSNKNYDEKYKNSDFGDNQKTDKESSKINTNDYLLPGYEQSQKSIDKIKRLRKQAQNYEQEEIERINE